jgi:hypothetical protein
VHRKIHIDFFSNYYLKFYVVFDRNVPA